MSTYGIDYYGLSKYGGLASGVSQGGGAPVVGSSTLLVTSLLAFQNGIGSVLISAVPPTDQTYTGIRLVRNKLGWAHRYDDGVVLQEDAGPLSVGIWGYQDSDLEEGRFYYYSIFVEVGGSWYLSGAISVLAVADFGYGDYSYALIPRVYKAPMNEITDPDGDFENTPLRTFNDIFSFHLNLIRTEYEVLLSANDSGVVDLLSLAALGQQLGIDPEPSLEPRLQRLRVSTASYQYRQKGSELGLRNAVNATTGWDIDVEYGANLMLNNDQATFSSPGWDDWDANRNYPIDYLVRESATLYISLAGTLNERPSVSPLAWDPVSNTLGEPFLGNWKRKVYYDTGDIVYDPNTEAYYEYIFATPAKKITVDNVTYWSPVSPTILAWKTQGSSSFSTWEETSYDVGITPTQDSLTLRVGTEGPLDLGDNTRNVLVVTNETGNPTGSIGVHHVAKRVEEAAIDRGQVALGGVPFENLPIWNPRAQYQYGDVVLYESNLYVCQGDVLGDAPSGVGVSNEFWRFSGLDDYNTFTASAYSKAVNTSTDFSTTIEWYDQYGNLIAQTGQPTTLASYDGFDDPGDRLLGVNDGSTIPWLANGDVWFGYQGTAALDEAVVAGVPGIYWTADTSWTDPDFVGGITFKSTPIVGRSHGIIFRSNTSDDCWMASRSQLIKREVGVDTVVASWTALENNERLVVSAIGNDITVSKYLPLVEGPVTSPTTKAWELTTLATTTDAFNNTYAEHGIFETVV